MYKACCIGSSAQTRQHAQGARPQRGRARTWCAPRQACHAGSTGWWGIPSRRIGNPGRRTCPRSPAIAQTASLSPRRPDAHREVWRARYGQLQVCESAADVQQQTVLLYLCEEGLRLSSACLCCWEACSALVNSTGCVRHVCVVRHNNIPWPP